MTEFVRPAPEVAYLALGSNLDNPIAQVLRAFAALEASGHTRILRRSSLYRTPPVGYADQPDFINAVASVRTELAPLALLDSLLAIEQEFGRVRLFANGPRTLDLDVLLYADCHLASDRLILPHPRMHERAFVMYPLREIAPDLHLPGRGRVADLAHQCDGSGIERITDNGQSLALDTLAV